MWILKMHFEIASIENEFVNFSRETCYLNWQFSVNFDVGAEIHTFQRKKKWFNAAIYWCAKVFECSSKLCLHIRLTLCDQNCVNRIFSQFLVEVDQLIPHVNFQVISLKSTHLKLVNWEHKLREQLILKQCDCIEYLWSSWFIKISMIHNDTRKTDFYINFMTLFTCSHNSLRHLRKKI